MTAASTDDTSGNPSKQAAAEYIAIQASRLARMASANDFPLLAYLIDMAVLEAWREASNPDRALSHDRRSPSNSRVDG